jgi:hypothetical protein
MKRGLSMKWIERSRSFAQSLAVSLATSTLVFAPVAQGAAAANAHGKAVKAPAKWIQSPLPKTPLDYNVDKKYVPRIDDHHRRR